MIIFLLANDRASEAFSVISNKKDGILNIIFRFKILKFRFRQNHNRRNLKSNLIFDKIYVF
jgi:hypothetical protein